MTSQTTAKIRLVKCPGCRVLLPEPNNPVYQCGGCGALLQAKNRKNDTVESGWLIDGTDVSQKMELDCTEDQKEINSLNQEATSSAGGESSGWSTNGTDVSQKLELDCIEDQKEINSLNQEATSSAGGQSSPEIDIICRWSLNQEATGSAGGESSPEIDIIGRWILI